MNLLKKEFIEEIKKEKVSTEDKDAIKKCFYELLKNTKKASNT